MDANQGGRETMGGLSQSAADTVVLLVARIVFASHSQLPALEDN